MSSIEDDERILLDDVIGSMAHDIMLHEQKIMSKQDLKSILTSLEEVRTLWIQDKIKKLVKKLEENFTQEGQEMIRSLLI
jgi:argininosuccinate lyase